MSEHGHHAPVVVQTGPDGVSARPARLRERILVRLLAGRLDRELARGVSPESCPLLSLRAQVLARPRTRTALARSIGELLRDARSPRGHGPAAPVVDLDGVRAVQDELAVLVDHLLAPAPLPARGIAMTYELLADGTGPLYGRVGRRELLRTVRAAVDALDPELDWPQAA